MELTRQLEMFKAGAQGEANAHIKTLELQLIESQSLVKKMNEDRSGMESEFKRYSIVLFYPTTNYINTKFTQLLEIVPRKCEI